MKEIRLHIAKFLTYVQLISFISIPVYLVLSLMFIGVLSNGILLVLSVGLVSFCVLRYFNVTPYLY